MEYKRTIEIYKTYYIEFYKLLPLDVRTKVNYVLELIRTENVIPEKYFKHLTGIKGLYEIRIEYKSNIYRIFCCLNKNKLVILFNGFQKKTQKTPQKEIRQSKRIMDEYFNEQKK